MPPLIDKPGIYQMPIECYVSDPAPQPSLNAGTAHTILTQTPAHAWINHPRLNPQYEKEESERFDIGTIAHALLLENDDSRVCVVEADDWRKKEAKEQRDNARLEGRLPVLAHQYESVKAMVDVARERIAESEIAGAFKEAIAEQTLIWEEEKGIWCRSRPDKLTPDFRVGMDYKTTEASAQPDAWARGILVRCGYDIQAALAKRGAEKLGKPHDFHFVFIVQETSEPYAVSFVSLEPRWWKLAEDKLHMAMTIWKTCTRTDKWPAYANRVAYVEPPAFAELGWMNNLPEMEMDAEDFV